MPGKSFRNCFPGSYTNHIRSKAHARRITNFSGWPADDNQNWWWLGGCYWLTGHRADDSTLAFANAESG
ncbi:MAG: hypothetical protein M1330_00400 [Armatimonadetes bacterium]|nr:hypothetical protein [Armatimonadota bacterium]